MPLSLNPTLEHDCAERKKRIREKGATTSRNCEHKAAVQEDTLKLEGLGAEKKGGGFDVRGVGPRGKKKDCLPSSAKIKIKADGHTSPFYRVNINWEEKKRGRGLEPKIERYSRGKRGNHC